MPARCDRLQPALPGNHRATAGISPPWQRSATGTSTTTTSGEPSAHRVALKDRPIDID